MFSILEITMIYHVGRLMQFAALIILPLAVMGELMHQISLKTELIMASIGIAIFVLGRMLQKKTK